MASVILLSKELQGLKIQKWNTMIVTKMWGVPHLQPCQRIQTTLSKARIGKMSSIYFHLSCLFVVENNYSIKIYMNCFWCTDNINHVLYITSQCYLECYTGLCNNGFLFYNTSNIHIMLILSGTYNNTLWGYFQT